MELPTDKATGTRSKCRRMTSRLRPTLIVALPNPTARQIVCCLYSVFRCEDKQNKTSMPIMATKIIFLVNELITTIDTIFM